MDNSLATSRTESNVELPERTPHPKGTAPAAPALPGFETCDRPARDRWDHHCRAVKTVNDLTMECLASWGADRHPDAAEVRLNTTWEDEARYTFAPEHSTAPTAPAIEIADTELKSTS